MKSLVLPFLTALSLFASCNHTSQKLVVVNLDKPESSITIKLSDVLDDITMVPLESRKDVLISNANVPIAITDQSIIVGESDALYQFDRSGKYIKPLALRGNGPNEYLRISGFFCDDFNNLLYYQDVRDRTLVCIDLNTGTFLPRHMVDVERYFIRSSDKQGNLYGFSETPGLMPRSESDLLTIAFQYNTKERAIKRFQSNREIPIFGYDKTMLYYKEELFLLNNSYSDTLYRMEQGDRLVPELLFQFANKKPDWESDGNFIRLLYKYKDGVVVQKCFKKIETMGRGFSEYNQAEGYYLIDKEYNLQAIGSVLIDPLSVTVPVLIGETQSPTRIYPFPTMQGQWGYMAMDAEKVLTLAQESLAGDQLSATQRKEIEELITQLDEYSNPVIIIGRVK